MQRLAMLALLAVALSVSATADTPAPGFQVSALAASPDINIDPFGFGFDVHGIGIELSNGDFVGFDGTAITRRSADGSLTTVYHTLQTPAFPSLVAVDPTETFFVVGESSFGDIYHVELLSGAVSLLANVRFNYDGAFDANGDFYVSHGAFVTGNGNSVSKIDLSTGSPELVAEVSGPSGPLEFDEAGNLYLGLIDQTFTPGGCRVVRFDATQVQGTALLDEDSAIPFSTGWDNLAFFAYDSESDKLFLVENDGIGPPEIYRVGPTKKASQPVAAGPTGTFIGHPRIGLHPGPSTFTAFQPADGGTLRYSLGNFLAGTLDRFEARPLRPVTFVEGPGITGFGPVTLGVSGARPGETVMFWYRDSMFLKPVEKVFFFPDLPPLFWGFGNAFSKGIPFFFPVDDDGRGGFSFFNPGMSPGLLGFQGVLTHIDVPAAKVIVEGTATAVVL